MIRFHTLGAVRLRADDGSDVQAVLAQPLQVALLTYLVVSRPRGFQRRDTLVGLFWPELDASHARGALSQAVYRLRGSMGRQVIAGRGREEVGVDERLLWSDVIAFEQALADGSLREALELYQGDLLTGFFLSGTPSWERWLEGERARLQHLAATAAWSLADDAAEDGRPEDAGHWGRRALALTPGDEASLRRLITLLDGIGDRAGAVRAYEETAELFAAEYATDPSPETQALIERVRTRTMPRNAAGPDPPPVPGEAAALPKGARYSPRTLTGVVTAGLVFSMTLLDGVPRSDTSAPEPRDAAPAAFSDMLADALPAGLDVDPAATDAETEHRRGRYYLDQLGGEAAFEALHRFQRALYLDATFVDAWSGLAAAYINLGTLGLLPPDEAFPRARAAAREALDLAPEHADAHALLAWTLSVYFWETAAAEHHFRRALEAGSDDARTFRYHAAHLRNLGRFEEALAAIRRAQELAPFHAFSRIEEGLIHHMAGDPDQAIEIYESLLRVAPGQRHAHMFIALAEAARPDYDAAMMALEKADPQIKVPVAIALRGYVFARTDRTEDARAMLRALDRAAAEHPVMPMQYALIHVGLGEHDQALGLLESGLDHPSTEMRLLGVEPLFGPLRDYPAFQRLLERIGLGD